MIFREAYMVGLIRDNCPNVKYAVAPLPKQKARAGYSILFQDSLMVYKFSPNKDLAWDWLKFVTTNEAVLARTGQGDRHAADAQGAVR